MQMLRCGATMQQWLLLLARLWQRLQERRLLLLPALQGWPALLLAQHQCSSWVSSWTTWLCLLQLHGWVRSSLLCSCLVSSRTVRSCCCQQKCRRQLSSSSRLLRMLQQLQVTMLQLMAPPPNSSSSS
jgi:hypothetical protein